jgi:hypothetical protein
MKIIILNLKETIMLPKTKNFNPLVDLKLSCTCGEDGCDKRSTKQMLLNMLQNTRGEYGFPMIILSGGRCPLHPNEKHRSIPADHQKCLGVDVRITGLAMALKIAVIAAKHGFNAIAINLKSGFIHLGYRPENNKIVTWEY